jgi:hypothetical protein
MAPKPERTVEKRTWRRLAQPGPGCSAPVVTLGARRAEDAAYMASEVWGLRRSAVE